MPDEPLDDDAPLSLLWRDLQEHPLWRRLEAAVLEKRDAMVAQLVTEDYKPRSIRGHGPQGGVAITAEHPFSVLARQQYAIGFIAALNEVAATPSKLQERAAAKAKETNR